MSDLENNNGVTPCTSEDCSGCEGCGTDGEATVTLTLDDGTVQECAVLTIFPVDDKTMNYIKGRVDRDITAFEADADAEYEQTIEIDLSALRPTIACPHLPENTKTIDELGHVEVQQSVICSCTNGRISDMRAAAEILKGRKVADGIRCIVLPATEEIVQQMIDEGIFQTFLAAGAAVSTPTCGPCLGGHMGCMCEGERCVSTTNRNFVGRMGHVTSEVILASPTVAAASAVAGCVADPAKL